MKQRWLRVALVNFLLAASIGALLRFAFVEEVSWMKFRNFLHAHSHVAMLGWVYMTLFALLIHVFLPEDRKKLSSYNTLFWVTQFSVFGMLVSFPLEGYGFVSITFSAVHIVCSYVFTLRFYRDLPRSTAFSTRLVKTALIFMVISTIGVWSMGPIMAFHLRGSALYYMAVQFYLHFQFNGWFLFAVLALFFRLLENRNVQLPLGRMRSFYIMLVIANVLTYALAVAWSQPLLSIFMINGTGVIVQLVALYLFIQLIWPIRAEVLNPLSTLEGWLIKISFLSFACKVIIQASVVIPLVAEAAYTIRNYVIGFVHLILLGAISFFLFVLILHQKQLTVQVRTSQWGIGLMIAGFLLSELLLFLQGTMLWGAKGFLPYYYEMLFVSSLLIPLGILVFLMAIKRQALSAVD